MKFEVLNVGIAGSQFVIDVELEDGELHTVSGYMDRSDEGIEYHFEDSKDLDSFDLVSAINAERQAEADRFYD